MAFPAALPAGFPSDEVAVVHGQLLAATPTASTAAAGAPTGWTVTVAVDGDDAMTQASAALRAAGAKVNDTLDFVARRIANPTVSTAGGPGAWYVADNVVQNHADVTADNWLGVDAEPGAYTQLSAPYPFADVPPATTAQVAYNQVLAGAGAILPRRDSVDARIVADVRAVSGRAINSQSEVGG